MKILLIMTAATTMTDGRRLRRLELTLSS